MEIPKFKVRRPEGERKPGEGPKSVQDMAWAKQRPESTSDFFRKRVLLMVGIVLVLALGMQVFSARTTPKGGKNLPDVSKSKSALSSEASGSETKQVKPPPGKPEVNFSMVRSDGKPMAQPEDTGGEAQPDPRPEEKAEDKKDDPAPGEQKQDAEKEGAEEKAPKKAGPSIDSMRTQFSYEEAKGRPFRELAPEFEALPTLDFDSAELKNAYETIYDDDLTKRDTILEASDLRHAHDIIQLYIRFLRTNSEKPEQLQNYYEARRKAIEEKLGEGRGVANFHNVMQDDYQAYRGHLFNFYGGLIKKYKMWNWNKKENKSGLRDSWMVICRDAKFKHYALIVPQDMRPFRSKDEVDAPDSVRWAGLFLQRWTYPSADGTEWKSMPVYVALRLTKVKPPDSGMTGVMIVLLILLAIGLVWVVRHMKQDEARANEVTQNLRKKIRDAKKKAGGKPEAGSADKPEGETGDAT